MSVFETKTITLRDGAVVTLRSPDEDDAQRLIEYLDRVRRETDGIMFDPADDLPTLDEERKWVRGIRDNDGSVQIAAEVDDRLVALWPAWTAANECASGTAPASASPSATAGATAAWAPR